ncbi:inositol monophosphatase [Corynebacterium sp. zg-331]|uniref:inositol monophosphatase family protein n=1 Tax=unclassified Corynebacterium TaxID=2624378 RepID=UPI00128E7C7A|nr:MULTISPECIES: inositol monophosphatase family protein [unclassified Corynebacterium]MBC3185419.1 inositol monophosphatase [Corynebacterium sp. zg-331]MPV51914.1 inositol monophosphatase [Corynebacterium sp. zg331]
MTDDRDPTLLRDLAQDWVRQAAAAIEKKKAELGDLRPYTFTKTSSVDPVTVVDTMTEELLVEAIAARRSGDGIIAEEGSSQRSTTGVSWIIDPIDGTVNFLYGLAHYAVSLAAAIDGTVVAAAVMNVADGSLYRAARGCGAQVVRGKRVTQLRVTETQQAAQALVATGFSYHAARRAQQARALQEILPRVRDIRRLGSAALDLCAVAEGRVDAYYEHGIHCWDYAAGALIAQEAGAVVEAPALSVPGEECRRTFAAAPGVAAEMKRVIDDAGAGTRLGD